MAEPSIECDGELAPGRADHDGLTPQNRWRRRSGICVLCHHAAVPYVAEGVSDRARLQWNPSVRQQPRLNLCKQLAAFKACHTPRMASPMLDGVHCVQQILDIQRLVGGHYPHDAARGMHALL
jgi:diadenosine tetraphosphatase ApaH/serine/threonine PP2A family protein phosphatase